MLERSADGLVASSLAAVLLAAGCIASSGAVTTLQAEQGSDLAIRLVVEDGQLTRSTAWWTDEPTPAASEDAEASGLEAVVLKNDVEVDRVPLTGDAQHAEMTWRAGQVDAVAEPGDEFEVSVLNATSGQALASFTVQIEA